MTALAPPRFHCPWLKLRNKINLMEEFLTLPKASKGRDLGMRGIAFRVPLSLPWFGFKKNLGICEAKQKGNTGPPVEISGASNKLWRACGQLSHEVGMRKQNKIILWGEKCRFGTCKQFSQASIVVSQLSDRMKTVHFHNASVFSESLLIHSPISNPEAAGTEERQVLMASSFRYETRERVEGVE